MKAREPIAQVGVTTDGRQVLDGAWFLHETLGFPLEATFDLWESRGFLPCWTRLYLQMVKSGMDSERAVRRILDAVVDSAFCPIRAQVEAGLARVVAEAEKKANK